MKTEWKHILNCFYYQEKASSLSSNGCDPVNEIWLVRKPASAMRHQQSETNSRVTANVCGPTEWHELPVKASNRTVRRFPTAVPPVDTRCRSEKLHWRESCQLTATLPHWRLMVEWLQRVSLIRRNHFSLNTKKKQWKQDSRGSTAAKISMLTRTQWQC